MKEGGGGGVSFSSNLKGGECFFLTYLGVSDILPNLKGGKCNLKKKKKNFSKGEALDLGLLNQNFPFRPTNNGLDMYLGQI